ncbi:MAG: hypothetical protein BWZ02_02400 [Lentisphaerae bacterium ADurb.BinA184]|nr:MAG: hypothetical protein BWZ02_02400 [Lentisphaerae bacterium ADurb.BinA184]
MAAGEQVVDHAHLRKQFAVLEGAGEAERRDIVRLPAGDVRATKADRAFARIDAADAVEHRGLAGAVRPDQRQQFAALDGERHAIQHHKSAETQRDPRSLPHRRRHGQLDVVVVVLRHKEAVPACPPGPGFGTQPAFLHESRFRPGRIPVDGVAETALDQVARRVVVTAPVQLHAKRNGAQTPVQSPAQLRGKAQSDVPQPDGFISEVQEGEGLHHAPRPQTEPLYHLDAQPLEQPPHDDPVASRGDRSGPQLAHGDLAAAHPTAQRVHVGAVGEDRAAAGPHPPRCHVKLQHVEGVLCRPMTGMNGPLRALWRQRRPSHPAAGTAAAPRPAATNQWAMSAVSSRLSGRLHAARQSPSCNSPPGPRPTRMVPTPWPDRVSSR